MNHLFNEVQKQFDYVDLNISYKDDNKSMLTSKIELFLQEIHLAVMIAPMEIWGVRDSIDLNKYLFSKYITDTFIATEITRFLQKHCIHANDFQWTIATEIASDNDGDEMVLIDAEIFDVDGEKILKSFVLGEHQSLIE